MYAIFKREVKAYFNTVIGWLYMGLFLLLTGIFFAFGNIFMGNSQFANFLGTVLFIYLFAVPLLTMRLFSEEKKQKTDQLLLTSPVTIPEIVLGKFFAALSIYCLTLLVTILYAVVIAIFGDLQLWETVGSYIGFIFLGASYISVGVFVSTSTENQITAALVTFFSLLLIWIIDPVSQLIPADMKTGIIGAAVLGVLFTAFVYVNTKNIFIALGVFVVSGAAIALFFLFKQQVFSGFLQNLLGWFSLNRRYDSFNRGLVQVDSLLYYASFCGLFLFLTIRLIEKRRWN